MYIQLRKFNIIGFVCIVLVLILLITTFVFGNTEPKATQLTYYKVVQVNKGDTLWSIAKTYNTDSDIRNFIVEIKTFNNMTSEVLIAGQNIVLPMHE